MVNDISASDAKAIARRLRTALDERGNDPGHSGALELVARAFGARDWNALSAGAAERGPEAGRPAEGQPVVPLLRIIDWASSRRFYVEFLGCTIEWEESAGDHAPRYVAIRMPSGHRLHLSEHHDDSTPGSALLIPVPDLDQQLTLLTATGYGAPPAIEQSRMGRSITVHDPVGNRLVFVAGLTPSRRISDEIPPIINEITLPVRPMQAFDRFTSFDWWRDYGLAEGGHVSIDDGEVTFHNPDGALSIGRVLVWEPGARYVQTFSLAQDVDYPTTLTVTFSAVPGGTRVRVEHGGWNATNADRRSHFADWPLILSRVAT